MAFILPAARLAAAQLLSMREVPVAVVSDWRCRKARLYPCGNKLAEMGGLRPTGLAIELGELAPLLTEAGLDIALTGFEPAEIDAIMGDLSIPERDPLDELPEITKTPVSRPATCGGSTGIVCFAASQRDADLHKLMAATLPHGFY